MMEKKLQELCGKSIEACSYEELYAALMTIVKEKSREKILPAEGRKLYYISAEFLIGKLLSNNLINLGLYEEADQCLQAHGKSMAELEEAEPEPSLGNGGLGRLAACFLDSLATLNLPETESASDTTAACFTSISAKTSRRRNRISGFRRTHGRRTPAKRIR